LIPPISNPEATVSFSAFVTDAAVPTANLSVAVIKPLENPTVAGAKKSFEDGAGTGAQLTDGAQQLDDNLLKLQAGAGQLLGGLIQLQDGAEQLSAGLNDTAVPGAEKLADGSEELAAGLNDTAVPGAEELAAGSEELAAGLNGTAVPGAEDLATGSAQVADGLDQLNAKIPALTQGIASLATGSAQVAAGLNQLEAGLDAPLPNGFGAGLDALATGLSTLPATVAGLKAAVASIATLPDCGAAACQPTVTAIVAQIGAEEPDIALAAGTAAALNNAYKTQIRPSIGQLSTGADQVAAGLAQLNSQIGPLATAVAQLAAGAGLVADGNAELAAGLTGAADGSLLLADGNAELAAGLTGAADGADQIADGNATLASGLSDAADGSEQIADGLTQAAPGATQIEDGAGRLSAEGSSQLIAAGNATALDFGARVAIIEASAERTADGGLPYGAPEDASAASAAYSYDIAGVGGLPDSDTTRAIVAILILVGAAAGASVLARR
jgi:putative membrane protein